MIVAPEGPQMSHGALSAQAGTGRFSAALHASIQRLAEADGGATDVSVGSYDRLLAIQAARERA